MVQIVVPHGTNLGPVLILLINSISEIRNCNGKVVADADDTALNITGKSWEEIKLES